jgi:thiamine-phosphate pyrophosphorylase
MDINKSFKSKFFFSNNISPQLIQKLVKLKNITFVYTPDKNLKNVYQIKNLCRKNKINFYISNNISLYYKIKADGFHLTSNNRNQIIKYTKPKIIIGTCHNQKEYFEKIKQGCKCVFLSPLFYNPKFSINRILGMTKFNLLKLNWRIKIFPLGGIFKNNIYKLNILKVSGFGFSRLIKKPF